MRRAFVMGSNGPDDPMLSKIRYATSDALRIRDHLSNSRCGFEVVQPCPGASIYDIQAELDNVARACSAEDTFVCYFAGHGLVEGTELFLLWDVSDVRGLLGTALPISQVMLTIRFCKAGSKLLILDCCHAGAAVGGEGLRSGINERAEDVGVKPENHMALLASDRIDRAREIEELGGGFLTTHICRALGEYFKEADTDGDAKLSLDELKIWLDKMASEHNRRYPDRRVPVPYLFGQRRGPFFLTLDAPAWVPYEISWPDESIMVVLPVRPIRNFAFCIGKHPITNRQYRNFVENGGEEPLGQQWVEEQKGVATLEDLGPFDRRSHWKGPFWPWRDTAFAQPDQPVVCISFFDALKYCKWVNNSLNCLGTTRLPSGYLWDLVASMARHLPRNNRLWLNQTEEIHHKSSAPAPLDLVGKRTNRLGIADMIGNIWEWVDTRHESSARIAVSSGVEVRSGSFLDDLSLRYRSMTNLHLSAENLPEKAETKHSDLGFRVSSAIHIRLLPDDVIHNLELHGEEIAPSLLYSMEDF